MLRSSVNSLPIARTSLGAGNGRFHNAAGCCERRSDLGPIWTASLCQLQSKSQIVSLCEVFLDFIFFVNTKEMYLPLTEWPIGRRQTKKRCGMSTIHILNRNTSIGTGKDVHGLKAQLGGLCGFGRPSTEAEERSSLVRRDFWPVSRPL
jgi:hypothetical protein